MRSRTSSGFTLIELLIVVAIIGILAAIAIPNLMMAVQRSKERRTMVNIRNAANAWEARATDMARYNASGIIGISTPVLTSDLEAILEPTYIRNLPTRDGWGYRLRFELDADIGSSTPAQKYAITSPGRDAAFQTSVTQGSFDNFDCDIVFTQGYFYTYPSSVQR